MISPQRRFFSLASLCSQKSRLLCRLNWGQWHVSDLLDQKLSFVNELLIILSIIQEISQEGQQLVSVDEKDFLYGNGLVRIGYKDLEHVKALVLNHLPVVSQKVHANLQMLPSIDISCHYGVIGPVKKDLAK